MKTGVYFIIGLIGLRFSACFAQKSKVDVRLVHVANGWANNSVNVVIFRKNSLYLLVIGISCTSQKKVNNSTLLKGSDR